MLFSESLRRKTEGLTKLSRAVKPRISQTKKTRPGVCGGISLASLSGMSRTHFVPHPLPSVPQEAHLRLGQPQDRGHPARMIWDRGHLARMGFRTPTVLWLPCPHELGPCASCPLRLGPQATCTLLPHAGECPPAKQTGDAPPPTLPPGPIGSSDLATRVRTRKLARTSPSSLLSTRQFSIPFVKTRRASRA